RVAATRRRLGAVVRLRSRRGRARARGSGSVRARGLARMHIDRARSRHGGGGRRGGAATPRTGSGSDPRGDGSAAALGDGAPPVSAAPLRVVVTRDEGLDGPLSSALAERGLEAVHCAVVGEAPAPDAEPLQRAARSLECYDWLVVASQR